MDSSVVFRQLLRAPPAYRALLQSSLRPQTRTFAAYAVPSTRYISTESLPRIAQPSFWTSLVPKPFRSAPNTSQTKRKEWNPATPFIILSLLVGSQAIQIIWLKREHLHFMQRAEAKIGVLKEVVERVQRGEDVDVEGILGTGIEEREKEWGGVLKEIEEEELLFQSKKKRQAMRRAAEEEEAKLRAEERSDLPNPVRVQSLEKVQDGKDKVETFKGARFY